MILQQTKHGRQPPKAPLLVYLDLHVVLTLSVYQAVLFLPRSIKNVEHDKGNADGEGKKRQEGKHFSQRNNDKCSFICKTYQFIRLFLDGASSPVLHFFLSLQLRILDSCRLLLLLTARRFFVKCTPCSVMLLRHNQEDIIIKFKHLPEI